MAAAFAVGAVTCAASTATVVLAKSPDTPEYLLPYYLRSTRARFNHYATLRENGRRYMTPQDFVAAMLALKDPAAACPAAADELAQLFAETDANNDGKLSFREFGFLSVLLITPMDDFRLAFRMFDEEGKGALTPAQFRAMVLAFGDDTMKPKMKSGIVRKMHAITEERRRNPTSKDKPRISRRKGAKKAADKVAANEPLPDTALIDFASFQDVVGEFSRAITVAEFRLADTDKTGYISRQAFGELLTSSILGRHVPFFLVENLRHIDDRASTAADDKAEGGPNDGKLSLDTWLLFSDMMRKSDAVNEALQMYTANGLPVLKPDFARAVAVAGLERPMTDAEVNFVFDLFDRDRDGTLEYDEFASVMKDKGTFHVLPQEKERRSLFSMVPTCAGEAFEAARAEA